MLSGNNFLKLCQKKKKNIRVNAVCPGMTETPMLRQTNTPEESQVIDFVVKKGLTMKKIENAIRISTFLFF